VPNTKRNQPKGPKEKRPPTAKETELVPGDSQRRADSGTGSQAGVNLQVINRASDTSSKYSVDPELAEFLDETASRIGYRGVELVRLVIESGNDLLAVKKKVPHGLFKTWVEGEFDFTLRTAESWMNAAAFAGEHPDIVDKVQATTLYRLAAPEIPETVRANVLAEIRAKMPPRTIKELDRLIKEARDPEQAPPVIEVNEADFDFTVDEVFEELDAESAMASHELQDLLLQHLPPELIGEIARLLRAVSNSDLLKLASRLDSIEIPSNSYEEVIRPSA
jgi:hypothetical protein